MLTELHITNFAIIEKQSVSFAAGLNVISGETGAGKSIILNALELIMGARPRAHFIRTGAESMEISAHFDLSEVSPKVIAELPDIARGEELVISRSMNQSGKGKVYINGRLGTVTLVEEIAQRLINICGQGQHIRLLEPRFHRELIDSYAANDEILARYQEKYSAYVTAAEELSRLEESLAQGERRRDELELTVNELSAVKLTPTLRADLERQVKRLESSEKIIDGLRAVTELLDGDDGVLEEVSAAGMKLAELTRLDPELDAQLKILYSAKAELKEVSGELGRYGSKVDLDQSSLSKLRDRLAEVARLERKYRMSDDALMQLLEKSRSELGMLADGAGFEKLSAEVTKKRSAALQEATKLSATRKKAGLALTKAVSKDLAALNMPDAELKLEIEEAELGEFGAERLELLISTNRGEPFKALKQIASGGELSRIMLVLKKTLRDRSGVNVLVFDEVDTGVSGGVARAVGQQLRELAKQSQVICITHLPQVASLADHHLVVDKKVGKRAVSVVRELSEPEKVDEIARMLAGYDITAASRESARELLTSKK